jgi:WD40 repeat protein
MSIVLFCIALCALSPAFSLAQLRITAPVAGESIFAANSTTIRWEGLSPNAPVRIEYSMDAGRTWLFLARAIGGAYTWRSVPDTVVLNRFVVRVTPERVLEPVAPNMAAFPEQFFVSIQESPITQRIITSYAEWIDSSRFAVIAYNRLDSSSPRGSIGFSTVNIWNIATSMREVNAVSGATQPIRLPNRSGATSWRPEPRGWSAGTAGNLLVNVGVIASRSLVSPDGTRLLRRLNDSMVSILNAQTGADLQQIVLPSPIVQQDTVQLMNANVRWDNQSRVILNLDRFRTPDILGLISQGIGTQTLVWNTALNQVIPTVINSPRQYSLPRCLPFIVRETSDGTFLSGNGEQFVGGCVADSIGIFNSATGMRTATIANANTQNVNTPFYLWCAGDSLILGLQRDLSGTPVSLTLWNAATGRIVNRMAIPTTSALNYRPDGERLLGYELQSARDSLGRMVFLPVARVYDIRTGNLISTLANYERRFRFGAGIDIESFATAPIWSPDGMRVAGQLAEDSTMIGIWDTNTGCLLYSVRDGAVTVRNGSTLQWNPDGTKLLSLSDQARVWNVPPVPCQAAASQASAIVRPGALAAPEGVIFAPFVCDTSALGTKPLLAIPIRNTGTEPLALSLALMPQPSEFQIARAPATLQPNTIDTCFIRFIPASLGTKIAQLTISAASTQATVQINAQRDTSSIALSTDTLRFATQQNGIQDLTFTVQNLGTVPLTAQALSAALRIAPPNAPFSIRNVAPTSTGDVDITVRFAASMMPQTAAATLLVRDLCGRTSPLALIASSQAPAALVAPAAITLASVLCSNPVDTALMFRNNGDVPLIIRDTIWTGANRDEFSLVGVSLPATVAARDSLLVTARFTPRTNGTKAATLVLTSNAGQAFVNVSAERKSISWRFVPDSVTFDNVRPLMPDSLTITAINDGTEPVTVDTSGINAPSSLFRLLPLGGQDTQILAGSQKTFLVRLTAGGLCRQDDARDFPFPPLPCDITPRLRVKVRTAFQAVLKTDDTISVENVRLGCERQRAVTLLMQNTGCRPLTVQGITWNSPDSALYRLTSDLRNRVIASGGQDSLSLLFTPKDTGNTNTTLTLFTDADNTPRKVIRLLARTDNYAFTATVQGIRFETAQADTRIDTTFTLANTGSKPITWPRTPIPIATNNAFVIQSIEPSTTAPLATSRVTVRFLGGAEGFSASEIWRVATVECPDVANTIALSASVEKKPRIALSIPTTSALTLPTLLCEAFKDTNIVLRSTGSDDLTQVQILLDDNAGGAFILTKQPKSVIPRGAQDTLTLRFRPLAAQPVGNFTGRIRILTNDAAQPAITLAVQARKDSTGIRILQTALSLPAVPENTPSALSFAVQNTGTVPLRWNLPVRLNNPANPHQHAFVLEQATPNPTPAGGTAQVLLRFLGGTAANQSNPLTLNASISDTCGRVYPFIASVRVIAGTLQMPDSIELAPREEQDILLKARIRGGIEAGLPMTVRLRLSNATLMDVLSPQAASASLQGQERVITFTGLVPSGITSDSVLLRLRVRGLLGNDTATTLRAESVRIAGVELERPTIGSTTQVHMAGFNRVGGLRLYYPKAIVKVLKASPNPVREHDHIMLTLEASEATEAEFRLVDMLGRRTPLGKRTLVAGVQVVELSTIEQSPVGISPTVRATALSSGWNVLEVLSVSGVQIIPIIIVR